MILEFPAKQVTATLLGRSRKTGLLKYQEIVQKTTKEQFWRRDLVNTLPFYHWDRVSSYGMDTLFWHV